MSWFSENYDKAAIGLGVAALLGVGAMAFLGSGQVEEDFALGGGKRGSADKTPNDWKVKHLLDSAANPASYAQKKFGTREVDLFVGVPTFVAEDDLSTAVDLLKGKEIHEGIPNTWWLEHKIDLGFSDSPERDADGDGFSNREEFEAGTDPREKSDFPAVINKLVLQNVEEKDWLIEHKGIVSGKTKLDLKLARREVYRSDYLAPGSLFPPKGPYKEQFKFIESISKMELNTRTNVEEKVDIAIVEDQRPHLDKRRYEVRSKKHPMEFRTIKRHYLGKDRTAVLVLDALGQGSNTFRVEEGKTFSLPAGQDEKPYRITKIAADGSVTVTGPGLDSPLTLTR